MYVPFLDLIILLIGMKEALPLQVLTVWGFFGAVPAGSPGGGAEMLWEPLPHRAEDKGLQAESSAQEWMVGGEKGWSE